MVHVHGHHLRRHPIAIPACVAHDHVRGAHVGKVLEFRHGAHHEGNNRHEETGIDKSGEQSGRERVIGLLKRKEEPASPIELLGRQIVVTMPVVATVSMVLPAVMAVAGIVRFMAVRPVQILVQHLQYGMRSLISTIC